MRASVQSEKPEGLAELSWRGLLAREERQMTQKSPALTLFHRLTAGATTVLQVPLPCPDKAAQAALFRLTVRRSRTIRRVSSRGGAGQ